MHLSALAFVSLAGSLNSLHDLSLHPLWRGRFEMLFECSSKHSWGVDEGMPDVQDRAIDMLQALLGSTQMYGFARNG